MTDDILGELSISHTNSQNTLNEEAAEIDIVATDKSKEYQQPTSPIRDCSKGVSAQIALENADDKHQVDSIVDNIQSKLSNYPLPKPEISKMTPPPPPSIP